MTEYLLSTRQLAVLQGVAWGLTRKQIAADLGVTVSCVRDNLDRSREKLNARNTAHLMAVAFRAGLLNGGIDED